MLIAIDTATKYLGLALYNDEQLIAEQMWRTGNKHNRILAPSIDHLLRTCDVTSDDLTLIAVANGPGSYTGLRIGVALAKGLATVRQLPLIGVSTLEVIAQGQPFSHTKHQLIAILPAGRKRIISSIYQVKKGRWTATRAPEISTWDELLVTLDAPSYLLAGEIDDAGLEAIASYDHPDVSLTLIDPAQRMRRPAILAREAWAIYQQGEVSDFLPAKLAPVYLNSPG